ncbi:MAG: hypothetical protein RI900_1272 [Actinomycetota bacterium]|jgi:2,4-dichlorophenol 6-monooxygenase
MVGMVGAVDAVDAGESVEVLIVGGGGAGLTASMLLARLGVDTLLVSAQATTSLQPKAHVLNQRAMEIMKDCGADADIYAIGTPPAQMSHTAYYAGFAGHPDAGRVLFKQESWGGGGLDEDWAAASPMVTTNLPQIRLEPVLKRRAEQLSPGRVRFHHEVLVMEQDADGVTASVLDHSTGRQYRVRARYLIACDGGRTIGRQVGVELQGVTDITRMASVYLSADLSAFLGDPDVLLRWVFSPQSGSLITLAPMGPTRWGGDSEEWVVHLGYRMADQRAHDDEAVLADLRSGLGIGSHPLDVHLISRWSIGGVVADRFRVGRVFVLGDAAHRHPPTGALGLTSAMHDAHNLCWKLALVVRGRAGEQLLDTYHDERRPVDARNVQRSLENAQAHGAIGRLLGVTNANLSPDERWRALAAMWGDGPDDRALQRQVIALMAAQSQEFREHDVEYGYAHRSSAVVPDGSPEPAPHDFRCYAPSTRPGSPLPHAWLEDSSFRRCSTLDLVGPARFVLIAGEDGLPWCEAARSVADELGLDLVAVAIGHAVGDLRDPRVRWQRVREFGPDGAVLVRPDRCVAWRSMGAVADPADALRVALRQILSV